MQPRRLYRSINNRNIAGVAGGIGDYLGIDPTIIRILLVIIALATAVVPTFIAYFILAAVLPEGYTSYGNRPNQQPPYQQQPPQQQPYQQPQQPPYQQQPGVAQPSSMQGAIENMVSGVERVGREIGAAIGLNRNAQPGYPPQQPGYPQQQGYPQQPQAQPSTYQGSNQLENMGTPVTNAPQPQAEAVPIPPAPQPYGGEAARGYGGNPNLGNMGQGGNGNPGPGNHGHTMNQMHGGAMVMRHNPWAGVLLGILLVTFVPMLIVAGLHLFGFGAGMIFHGVGFGFHGIGWLLGRILPLFIIGMVILSLVSRGRRHRRM